MLICFALLVRTMTEVNPVIPAQLQAHKNGIDTMPLVCDGFRPLTVEALRTISTLWSSQQIQMLANYGISIEDVTLPAACPWSPWKQGFQRSLHMTL